MPKGILRQNKRKSHKRSQNRVKEASARTVVYKGPIRVKGASNETDTHSIVLTEEFSLTSSAGGVIALVQPDNPNATANWSNFVNCFDEYRVLAFELWYMPNNRYSKSVTVTTPILMVIDHDSATALSSYSQAAQYASVRQFALDDPFKMVARMADVSEASFLNTTAPAARFWIKAYSTGLTVSTSYGVVIVSYKVQFRGTGL